MGCAASEEATANVEVDFVLQEGDETFQAAAADLFELNPHLPSLLAIVELAEFHEDGSLRSWYHHTFPALYSVDSPKGTSRASISRNFPNRSASCAFEAICERHCTGVL